MSPSPMHPTFTELLRLLTDPGGTVQRLRRLPRLPAGPDAEVRPQRASGCRGMAARPRNSRTPAPALQRGPGSAMRRAFLEVAWQCLVAWAGVPVEARASLLRGGKK